VVDLGSEAAGSETEGSAETPEVEVLGPEVASSEAAGSEAEDSAETPEVAVLGSEATGLEEASGLALRKTGCSAGLVVERSEATEGSFATKDLACEEVKSPASPK
jgi:hypothetical protein